MQAWVNNQSMFDYIMPDVIPHESLVVIAGIVEIWNVELIRPILQLQFGVQPEWTDHVLIGIGDQLAQAMTTAP